MRAKAINPIKLVNPGAHSVLARKARKRKLEQTKGKKIINKRERLYSYKSSLVAFPSRLPICLYEDYILHIH